MRQWVGERVVRNMSENAATITNLPFELTVGVPINDILDDNIGTYQARASLMGHAAKMWPDQQLKSALQNGTTNLAFDGTEFFSNSRTLGGNTIDNLHASTALTPANYATVRETMMSYLDSNDESLEVMPDLLLVPPQLEREARMILQAEAIPDPGGVATTVPNIYRGSATLIVDPRLANEGTVWYMIDSSIPDLRPFVWQLRQAPQLVQLTAETNEHVFKNKEYLYGIDSRGAAGYALPWLCSRCAA
jgi:phage major head subunit gpT-like protein